MEQELLLLRKKRKMLLDYNLLNRHDYRDLVEEIDDALIDLAPHLIGLENGLTNLELLYNIFKFNPQTLNSYQLITFISILKYRIHKLRAQGDAFFLKKGSKVFILKTQKEADDYKNLLKRDIESFKKSMIKADDWVKNKKYLDLKPLKKIIEIVSEDDEEDEDIDKEVEVILNEA